MLRRSHPEQFRRVARAITYQLLKTAFTETAGSLIAFQPKNGRDGQMDHLLTRGSAAQAFTEPRR